MSRVPAAIPVTHLAGSHTTAWDVTSPATVKSGDTGTDCHDVPVLGPLLLHRAAQVDFLQSAMFPWSF